MVWGYRGSSSNLFSQAVSVAEVLAGTLGDKLAAQSVGRRNRPRSERRRDGVRRILLLYLNEDTWLGEKGNLLADQVRAARKTGVRIVMVHERDTARGGCEIQQVQNWVAAVFSHWAAFSWSQHCPSGGEASLLPT